VVGKDLVYIIGFRTGAVKKYVEKWKSYKLQEDNTDNICYCSARGKQCERKTLVARRFPKALDDGVKEDRRVRHCLCFSTVDFNFGRKSAL